MSNNTDNNTSNIIDNLANESTNISSLEEELMSEIVQEKKITNNAITSMVNIVRDIKDNGQVSTAGIIDELFNRYLTQKGYNEAKQTSPEFVSFVGGVSQILSQVEDKKMIINNNNAEFLMDSCNQLIGAFLDKKINKEEYMSKYLDVMRSVCTTVTPIIAQEEITTPIVAQEEITTPIVNTEEIMTPVELTPAQVQSILDTSNKNNN